MNGGCVGDLDQLQVGVGVVHVFSGIEYVVAVCLHDVVVIV